LEEKHSALHRRLLFPDQVHFSGTTLFAIFSEVPSKALPQRLLPQLLALHVEFGDFRIEFLDFLLMAFDT